MIAFLKIMRHNIDWQGLGLLQGAKDPDGLTSWFDQIASYLLQPNFDERLLIQRGYRIDEWLFPIIRRVHQGILGKTKKKINLVDAEKFFTFVSEWIAKHIDFYTSMTEKVKFDLEGTMAAKLSDEIIDIIINDNEDEEIVSTEEIETEEETDDGTEGLDT